MFENKITNVKLPILSRNEIFDRFEHLVFFIQGRVYDTTDGWLLDRLTQISLENNIQQPFNNRNVVQLMKEGTPYKKLLADNPSLIKIFAEYKTVKGYYDIQKNTGNLNLFAAIKWLMSSNIPFTCEGGKNRGTIVFKQDSFLYVLMDKIWITKTFDVTPYNYNTINLNQKLNLEGFYV